MKEDQCLSANTFPDKVEQSLDKEDQDEFKEHLAILLEGDFTESPRSLEYFCDVLIQAMELHPKQQIHVNTNVSENQQLQKQFPEYELLMMQIAVTFDIHLNEERLNENAIKNLKLILETLGKTTYAPSLEARQQMIEELSIYTVAKAIEISSTPPQLSPRFNK